MNTDIDMVALPMPKGEAVYFVLNIFHLLYYYMYLRHNVISSLRQCLYRLCLHAVQSHHTTNKSTAVVLLVGVSLTKERLFLYK